MKKLTIILGLIIAVMLVAGTSYAALTDGLVSYWQFEDGDSSPTAADSAGSNTGTVNGATWTSSGRVGGALSFDGGNDYVNLGSDSSIDNIFAGGGTVSFWINPATSGGGTSGKGIISTWTTGAWYATIPVSTISGNDAKLYFSRGFSGDQGYWGPSSVVTGILGSWHHVAIVYNKDSAGNDPIIYIDGVSVAISEAGTPSGSALPDTSDLILGSLTTDSHIDFGYAGTIDEVAIWNRALSGDELGGDEIGLIFDTGVAGQDLYNPIPEPVSCISLLIGLGLAVKRRFKR